MNLEVHQLNLNRTLNQTAYSAHCHAIIVKSKTINIVRIPGLSSACRALAVEAEVTIIGFSILFSKSSKAMPNILAQAIKTPRQFRTCFQFQKPQSAFTSVSTCWRHVWHAVISNLQPADLLEHGSLRVWLQSCHVTLLYCVPRSSNTFQS